MSTVRYVFDAGRNIHEVDLDSEEYIRSVKLVMAKDPEFLAMVSSKELQDQVSKALGIGALTKAHKLVHRLEAVVDNDMNMGMRARETELRKVVWGLLSLLLEDSHEGGADDKTDPKPEDAPASRSPPF